MVPGMRLTTLPPSFPHIVLSFTLPSLLPISLLPSYPPSFSLSFHHPPLHSSEFCNVYLVCCIHLLVTLCNLPVFHTTAMIRFVCNETSCNTRYTCSPFISFIVLLGYSGRLFQQLCVGYGGTTVHVHTLRGNQ